MLIKNSASLPMDNYRHAMNNAYRMDEDQAVNDLIVAAQLSNDVLNKINKRAEQLVIEVRKNRSKSGIDAFMAQYELSSAEGIALMCLAEALLRIPDETTAEKFIRDKLASPNWRSHLGKSESLFVNAATWGLMITGKVMSFEENQTKALKTSLKKLINKSGEKVIRKIIPHAMKILGNQFVMGETIEDSLKRARSNEERGYRYSYDMLGEAARTEKDALRYFASYQKAIIAIGKEAKQQNLYDRPGISVKLSALHPRYEFAKRDKVIPIVQERLIALCELAMKQNISLTVDAEEANRLDLSLDVMEGVYQHASLHDWHGFGLAVQSYQKRAFYLLDYLYALTQKYDRKIMIRLIKGAYWDSEIKMSQQDGFSGYPVFTRKASTDVSFIACAKKLLTMTDSIYPMFATHNAHTLATVYELAGEKTDYEFQCLHGMGISLYDQVVGKDKLNKPCRVYAPVGGHEDLLAYLVRRLLENGANTSFVNRIANEDEDIANIIADPVSLTEKLSQKSHPKIPLPENIYGASRKNSRGYDLSNTIVLMELAEQMTKYEDHIWQASPLVNGEYLSCHSVKTFEPQNATKVVGTVIEARDDQVEMALEIAQQQVNSWRDVPVKERADILGKAADLLESHGAELMALAIREAGKTMNDAIAELREAVDFCRYYAQQAVLQLSNVTLPGPTGELNQLSYHGRGIVLCISPWNFPLAIFLGQVSAALVAGNVVIAKPAEQTPLMACRAAELLHQAGVPKAALQVLPGRGEVIGAQLVADKRIKAVMFTGGTDTARIINQTLAQRPGEIVPLIAETGGQNAMIVDSTALPEQVIDDVIRSAFHSAGQRCSALRVMFIQQEVANKFIEMLAGAMAELQLGDPSLLTTDVGPVIDDEAYKNLQNHLDELSHHGKLIYRVKLPDELNSGKFFPPSAYEIKSLSELKRENFGPILHVIRFKSNELDQVINQINDTGYGLTFGVHSRINETVDYILSRVNAGNNYVNRNMIGAVVGVQPFGGEGLSGTGPKAGGPNYLHRLSLERSISVNTTAAGGNASLLSLSEI